MNYKAEVLKRHPSACVAQVPVGLKNFYRIETAKGPLGDWRTNIAEAWKSAFLKLVEGR